MEVSQLVEKWLKRCGRFTYAFCRCRYLWPLIHYHKFLAKCIKKLKRNGIDVKTAFSPVCVFLREEVCAVSDHLAAVSLFDSDEWMSCLKHFEGWTDQSPKAIARLRALVSKQKLRAISDPRDVDSPLLRSQIDEQFLRAMAAARQSMIVGNVSEERRKPPREPRPTEVQGRDDSQPTSIQSVSRILGWFINHLVTFCTNAHSCTLASWTGTCLSL